ncbi:hypothetical protein AJ80_08416 [Polytolypa hystricis UAMH7299]|uniref:BTB domain-containing protein n=1 Tax=Polytolypa hystricis (strain UAMH7299) TaxID=1447883 RepID=A0A2B7X7W6_POLH7|nr:hypothetical protein AJ80_08416 [Polytolypa hystricis UAMH7299]
MGTSIKVSEAGHVETFQGNGTEIFCQTDAEHKVHKIVVCGQSEFFSRMFDGDWKETLESVTELKADDPRAIKAMISFMYMFDYDSGSGGLSPMLFDAMVYGVAEKYGVAALKTCAKKKFENAVQTC